MDLGTPLDWGLYIHSPFCVHKCGYCDFNSWGEARREPQKKWLDAILRQMRYWSQKLPRNAQFNTVFWGGGTPSLIENDIMAEFFATLKNEFRFSDDCEYTLEANPETLDNAKLQLYRELGVNRLSLGIQSFQDKFLERLERRARRKDNLRALELVATHWSGRWSLDLMFALPQQTLAEWSEDLELGLSFGGQHISAYQLTLSTERSKNWQQAGETGLLEFFNLTEQVLCAQGLERYEVSNFAVPGQECRHNIKYWDISPFLGLGPGASGLVGGSSVREPGFHQKNPDNFDVWALHAGSPIFESANLSARSARDDLHERLMMGLRLKQGFDPLKLGPWSEPFATLIGGAAYRDFFRPLATGKIACTPAGLRILDSLLVRLFEDLDKIN